MKLLHIGDLHIGKKLNDIILLNDQKIVLNQIIQISIEEDVDGILIAGDVYDKNSPSNEAMDLFNDFITKLVKLEKKVYIIAGNHDANQKISYFSYLLRKNNVFVSEEFLGTTQEIIENDEYGEVHIHLLPFIKPIFVKKIYPNEIINTYEDAIKTTLGHSKVDVNNRNILLCHQFITGSETSDSEQLAIGGLDNIDYTVFDDFDYVALGHIHKAQKVGRDTLRYSGSILKYSFSEANHVKSCTLLNIKEKGNIEIKKIPLIQRNDVRIIKGNYDEIISMPYSLDYVKIILEDEIVPIDARYNILMVFPNMMKLVLANSRTDDDNTIEITDDFRLASIMDLFIDFYKIQNNNVEPTLEQREILESILKELEDYNK